MTAEFDVVQPEDLCGLTGVFDTLAGGRSVVLGIAGSISEELRPPEGEGPFLGIFSSGSTGHPKLIWRRWADLLAEARAVDRVRGWRWASPYTARTFAGVQLALQAWSSGGGVTSLAGRTWEDAWRLAIEEGWDAVSATPTYLDIWIQHEPAGMRRVQLRQVTIGGEVLRPGCGARLLERFPGARFTTIYASAEWGVLLKTHRLDGWYEKEGLDRRRPGWRVEGGMLMLPMEGGAWGRTGDLVECEGELIRVVGRADRVANVAGTKVNLDEVSRLAELVPGVLRASAMAESNSVTGEVVSLHYAVREGEELAATEARLAEALRRQLPKAAWPRRWVCGDVGPSLNGKRRVR